MESPWRRRPGVRGGAYALAAAAFFGASVPFVKHLGRGVAPWTTAGLLYAGASFIFLLYRPGGEGEAPLRRAHLPRILVTALCGAVAAPAALAWGLQRTSALSASLLLNFEVVFAVVLARLLHGEHVGRRVAAGVAVLAAGGAVVVAGGVEVGGAGPAGLAAVFAATAGWALDSVLSSPLSDVDPRPVVMAKGSLGAAVSLAVGTLSGEPLPPVPLAAGLLLAGAAGYGLSLRYFLLAQREFGAARTSTVFASSPFLGALAAMALGERLAPGMPAGFVLTLAGVVLIVTERHEHPHFHPPLEAEGVPGEEGPQAPHSHAHGADRLHRHDHR